MLYTLSFKKPQQHFIDIELIQTNIQSDEVTLQLPAWRPGRYELGNFAKNIQRFAAFDENNHNLHFEKISKDCWKIYTKSVKQLRVSYNYYAAEINAGSSYLDEQQLYVNPVNCCMYNTEAINEKGNLIINVPSDYKIAIALKAKSESESTVFEFDDFHQLADSPFIASNNLKHHSFISNAITFHLWFQGECNPDFIKLEIDFKLFCELQLQLFGKAPFEHYHFLFQLLPYKFYHGVEHTASTVIALGPGYNLMKEKTYEDLLGVSCHELFHAWNIKTIRPIEMMPYNYKSENYSKLGYVCEGITTYYGDYLLFRSKVFSQEEYFKTFNERLQKHFDNFGRFNMSVAASSFDTWLDGYVPGIPNRKTSIYDEGCLLAFITDIFIRKNSANTYSLDDVMRYLNSEYALKFKGYSELDYKYAIEFFAGKSFDDIFSNYINGTNDYTALLDDVMDYLGCKLFIKPSERYHESALGFKINDNALATKIVSLYPNSAADKAGLALGDDIVSINDILIKSDGSGSNFSEWCTYFADKTILLNVVRFGQIKTITLDKKREESFFKTYSIAKLENPTSLQKTNFSIWSNMPNK
jgi:predicted metalloprotease with PDZ domain